MGHKYTFVWLFLRDKRRLQVTSCSDKAEIPSYILACLANILCKRNLKCIYSAVVVYLGKKLWIYKDI